MHSHSVSLKQLHYFISSTLLFLLTVITLFSSGCTEEDPASPPTEDNLSNPAVKPVVLFTHPEDNSTGPFNNLFDGSQFNAPPHFVIRFNKLMNLFSFQRTMVRIQGFDRPVYVNLYGRYFEREGVKKISSTYDDVFDFIVRDSAFFNLLIYQIGKSYTVTLLAGLEDINGNRVETQHQFSYTPEPYFRVRKVYPEDGKSNISSTKKVYLYFNSPIDTTIFPFLHLTPEVDGIWRIDPYPDSSIAYFQPWGNLEFDQTYVVTVDPTAKDRNGNQINSLFTSTFSVSQFRIYSTSPANGTTNVSPWTSVSASFNGLVDTSTVRSAFSIDPPITGILNIYSNNFYFKSFDIFAPQTTYTVTLSTALKSIDGTALKSPHQFSFTTQPFRVNGTNPSDGQSYVSLQQNIGVSFNVDIDTGTVRQAFLIDPPVSGTFHLYDPSYTFSFNPTAFTGNTTYTVTLTTALRSRGGSNLPEPYTFRFRTVP